MIKNNKFILLLSIVLLIGCIGVVSANTTTLTDNSFTIKIDEKSKYLDVSINPTLSPNSYVIFNNEKYTDIKDRVILNNLESFKTYQFIIYDNDSKTNSNFIYTTHDINALLESEYIDSNLLVIGIIVFVFIFLCIGFYSPILHVLGIFLSGVLFIYLTKNDYNHLVILIDVFLMIANIIAMSDKILKD